MTTAVSVDGISTSERTTSRRATDMERDMSLGATKYALKPSSYPELVAFANDIAEIARG